MPKKCGHMENKQLIPAAEMAAKVRGRRRGPAQRRFPASSPAPTPARSRASMRRIDRARRYRDAGADVLFIEAPQSIAELETIAATFAGDVPLLFNYAEGGKSPACQPRPACRARLPDRDLPDQHAARRDRRDPLRARADQSRRQPGSRARTSCCRSTTSSTSSACPRSESSSSASPRARRRAARSRLRPTQRYVPRGVG